jgi:3-hydroxymyristoyl/3-hydroxydecanoyl-(acyl carrier protein) dehydratase
VLETIQESPGHASLLLRMPPDLLCLRGHFADLPVVPAAMQLGWALAFAAELLAVGAAMRSLRATKFTRLIQPGQMLRLIIAADTARSSMEFEYRSAAGRHSGGRILFGDTDA